LSALAGALGKYKEEKRVNEPGSRVIYMLPALSSSGQLLDMLSGERGFFGEKPDIWSWSEMYSRLTPEKDLRRQIDPPDHRLILQYVLDSNIKELDGQGSYVPSGARRRGFIDILSLSIRELLLEGVGPDMILAGLEAPGTQELGKSARKDLLYRLYSDYLLYLEENGLADNSQIPSLLYGSLSRGLPEALDGAVLCWVGFLSFTGSQLRLVKALRHLGQEMEFFMPETGLDGFHDISAQMGTDAESLGPRGGAVITLKARDAYAQYERIAEEIVGASLGRGALWGFLSGLTEEGRAEALEDIGMLVPRDRLRLVVSALEKHGVPHQPRYETPVSETRVVELARRAWEAYRLDWPARRVWHLLRESGASGPALGAQAPSFSQSGLDVWKDALTGDPARLAFLEKLSAFCHYIDDERGHTGEELLRALLRLYGEEQEACLAEEAGDDLSLDFAVRALASSRLELEQKINMLRELTPPLGDAGQVTFRGAEGMAFLSNWASCAVTALQPPMRGAVSIYDSPPSVLVSHKVWIMTDVDPVRYSGQSSEQPLLDETLRKGVNSFSGPGYPDNRGGSGNLEQPGGMEGSAHLPTLHEKREQKEAMFRRLVSLGEIVTVAARSKLDSHGREQGDSPFLLSMLAGGLSQKPGPSKSWFVAGAMPGEVRSAELTRPALSRGVFPRTAKLAAAAAGGAGKQKLRISASAIDEFADCPFSYWCGHIANFEPPSDEPGIFGRMFQGSLVHDIWHMTWRKYLDRERCSTLSAILLAEWGGFLRALEGKYPGLSDGTAAAEIANLRDSMTRAAIAQDEAEARAATAGLEKERTELEFRLPFYETENAAISGRADRVDIWKGLGAVILDYKLGASDRYKDSLQLAVYAAMIREAGLPVAGFGYIGHMDGKIRGSWSPDVETVYKGASRTKDEGIGIKIERALEIMEEIDRIALSGEFRANYGAGRCPDCQWQTICRRFERGGFYDMLDMPGNDAASGFDIGEATL
jgi:RecB family exonuclease